MKEKPDNPILLSEHCTDFFEIRTRGKKGKGNEKKFFLGGIFFLKLPPHIMVRRVAPRPARSFAKCPRVATGPSDCFVEFATITGDRFTVDESEWRNFSCLFLFFWSNLFATFHRVAPRLTGPSQSGMATVHR